MTRMAEITVFDKLQGDYTNLPVRLSQDPTNELEFLLGEDYEVDAPNGLMLAAVLSGDYVPTETDHGWVISKDAAGETHTVTAQRQGRHIVLDGGVGMTAHGALELAELLTKLAGEVIYQRVREKMTRGNLSTQEARP